MKPAVYIFRGAPASGKGTVVPKFCELLPKPVALISQDALRWGVHLIGRNVEDVQEDEHRFAYKNTLLMYEQYLKNGRYNIVVEGLFTWDDETVSQGSVKQLLEMAKKYEFDAKSIVLQADREVLKKRNSERSYVVPAEEFEDLYASIYKTIDSFEVVVNSSNQSIEETLEQLKTEV